MKKFLTIALVIGWSAVFAQTNRTDAAGSGIAEGIIKAANSNQFAGVTTVFFNPKKKAEGSVHLFKTWDNFTVIHTTDGQKFSLNNINLNLERNAFESQVGQDSIFTFNFNNVKMFVVNNKIFKNYFYNGESKVFQSIYDGNDFELLKGYKVDLIQGSANPMLNRSTDKYVQKEYYYIRQNDMVQSFKLKKKNVAKLLGDDEEAKKLIEFAKKQRP